jgi:CheY-like chemotaxis protein
MTEFLAALLRMGGYLPLVANNADEAEALVRFEKPDVILCDTVMPRISGLELIARLKANPETCSTPVILMSGYDASIAATSAADGFLSKPFTVKEVMAAIESVVSPSAPSLIRKERPRDFEQESAVAGTLA